MADKMTGERARRLGVPVGIGAIALSVVFAWAVAIQEVPVEDIALLLLGTGAVLASIRRPEVGALVLLSLVLLLPREVLFERGVPLLGGQVKVTDVLLAVTFGAWFVRRELRLDRRRLPSMSFSVLMAIVAIGTGAALLTAQGRGTPLDLSLQELRPLLAYLLVFPIVGSTRNLEDLAKGLRLALAVAVASSLVTVLRYMTAGRPDGGGADGELVRVLDDAFLAPLFTVTWAVVLYAFARTARERLLLVCAAGIGLSGLFVTFQRGAWVATLAAVMVILLLVSTRARGRLALAMCGVALIAGAAALLAGANSQEGVADPGTAAATRLESIAFFENDPSARHRLAEWSRASELIREEPFTGIGLGSGITFYSPLYRVRSDAIGGAFVTYYIHNSYIWFALKLGVIAAVAFFAMVLGTAVRALRAYRAADDGGARALLLGSLAGITSLLVLSVSGPHLNFDRSTTYAAVLIGVVQVAPRLRRSHARALLETSKGRPAPLVTARS